MDRCGKCGCEVPPGTGKLKRIDVGDVGGTPVRADRLVCDSCAANIEQMQRGCLMVLVFLAVIFGLIWLGFFINDAFFRPEDAFRYGR